MKKVLYVSPRYVQFKMFYESLQHLRRYLGRSGINLEILVLNDDKKHETEREGFFRLGEGHKEKIGMLEKKYNFSTKKICIPESTQVDKSLSQVVQEKEDILPRLHSFVGKRKYDAVIRSQSTNAEFYFLSQTDTVGYENLIYIHDFFGRIVFYKEKGNGELEIVKAKLSPPSDHKKIIQRVREKKYFEEEHVESRKKYTKKESNIISEKTLELSREIVDLIPTYKENKLKRKIEEKLKNRKYKHYNGSLKGKYIFIPLHKPAESGLEWRSRPFSDQKYLVDVVSKNLPHRYKVVVKEHPSWESQYKYSLVKDIASKKDVEMVPPKTSSKEIIKKSQGVALMNNTTGFEAMVFGKPIISFAPSAYANHQNVVKVRNLYNTDVKIQNAIQKDIDTDKNIKFLRNMSKWSCDLAYQGFSINSIKEAKKKAKKMSRSLKKVINTEVK